MILFEYKEDILGYEEMVYSSFSELQSIMNLGSSPENYASNF
jgi:hypothetical protein